ncbi:bifunctional MIF4G-like [Babesia duncani]|uniref:Bifunctional MIF4G-like n=1 Tax=Babesia duncani TaxID=323732 RepID=A0AAD9PHQ9_9APIC|nr:bifunctional MIF4G-like [Babesia duncani]
MSRRGNDNEAESIRRLIKGNLNKLTIEKFETLAEKIATQCESLSNYSHLETIVALIIDKAVLEPDWSEMYADLCQILYWRSLEFNVGDKSLSFSSALLTKIQQEYETTPHDLLINAQENDDELHSKRLKTRILGTVKMIGELFQRKMLGFKIVSKVVKDLVIANEEPLEHYIECFVQLVYCTGYFIDSNPNLRPVLDMWFGRLKELMLKKGYSKRIKCVMQDVLDLSKAQWRKKIHRETAKSLSDLREQVNTENILGGSALAAQFGNIVIVGQRNNLYANCAYGGYMRKQEHIYKAKRAATQK